LFWHHGKAIPLFRVIVVKLVERVIEWVSVFLFLTDYSEDSASLRVALDFQLFDVDSLRCFGDDVERISCTAGGDVGARGLWVVQAKEGDGLFLTTSGVVEARCKTKTAVILRQGLMLVPITY
jgi:hypothetical protein